MTDSPTTQGTERDVRLVVADVDGTLVTPDKKLTPRTRVKIVGVIDDSDAMARSVEQMRRPSSVICGCVLKAGVSD